MEKHRVYGVFKYYTGRSEDAEELGTFWSRARADAWITHLRAGNPEATYEIREITVGPTKAKLLQEDEARHTDEQGPTLHLRNAQDLVAEYRDIREERATLDDEEEH